MSVSVSPPRHDFASPALAPRVLENSSQIAQALKNAHSLTHEEWDAIIDALFEKEGPEGLSSIPKEAHIPQEVLVIKAIKAIYKNRYMHVRALLNRKLTTLEDQFLPLALRHEAFESAAELFLYHVNASQLSRDELASLYVYLIDHYDCKLLKEYHLDKPALTYALETLCLNRNKKGIQIAVYLGADINQPDLFLKLASSDLEIALALYENGFNLNCLGDVKRNAFILQVASNYHRDEIRASSRQFHQVTLTLLFLGDVSIKIKISLILLGAVASEVDLSVLLDKAFQEGDQEACICFRLLLSKMRRATERKYLDLCLASNLVPLSSFKNYRFSQGLLNERLLHCTKAADEEAVKKLLSLGAEPNSCDQQEKIPLHYALELKLSSIAILLAYAGSDLIRRNSEQKNALDLANDLGESYQLIQKLHDETKPLVAEMHKDILLENRLKSQELSQLAIFIRAILPQHSDKAFSKITKTRVTRSFTINYRNAGGKRTLFILLQSRGEINACGTFQKVTETIRIPLEKDDVLGIATSDVQSISNKTLARVDLNDARKGQQIHKEVNDLEGIWPLYDAFEYRQETDSQILQRMVSYAPRAEEFHSVARRIPPSHLIKSLIFLTKGLANLHARNIIHGDIKGSNALFGCILNEVKAGWIDFGFSFHEGIDELNFVLKAGFYGSLVSTPPELFGVAQFSGDLKKVEIYAFGYMIYYALHSKYPEWQPFLLKHKGIPVSPDAQYEFRGYLQKHIEKPLASGSPQNIHDQIRYLAYKMMRIDPEKRISLNTLLAELEKLEASLNP